MNQRPTPPPVDQWLSASSANSAVTPTDNARQFVVYNVYRALVAFCLMAILINPSTTGLLAGFDRSLFIAGCAALLASAVLLTGRWGDRLQQSEAGIFGLMLADIFATALIASGSGGLFNGFSVLYLITVAAAAVMLSTRILATLVAALAVLAILADAFWMVTQGLASVSALLPAGILGSLLFTVSLLVQLMASRLSAAEAQTEAAEFRVAALQQLNEQIILHMDTGILITDKQGALRPINVAANRLLNLPTGIDVTLSRISPELANQYDEWCEVGQHRKEPFRIDTNGPVMIASFARLDDQQDSSHLIFIEDYTPVTQFAQSIKLNSLSKLTASIAHEIRNPLAAIRHAAQLMSESGTIDEADNILCDILVNNSDRVSDIIDNVTEVSRRAAPNPERLTMNEWLPRYLEEYKQQLTETVALTLDVTEQAASVHIDPNHLKRVLSNLLDNALRHSKQDSGESAAAIRLSVDDHQGQVHMDIVDFGRGVTEHHIGRLFEPFFTTSTEGSGLGLYLCKELCEINGAGLFYHRTPADESAFRLSFKQEGS